MNRQLPPFSPARVRVGVLALVVASVLVGCIGDGAASPSGESASTAITLEGRAVAVEAARAAVQAPTAELLDAAGELAGLSEQWQSNRAGVDLTRQAARPIRAARAASAAARNALDAAAGPDVAAADEVLWELADRVEAQADTLASLRADEAATRPVDALGAVFVERINDRGSRTPQRLAMEALVAQVDSLAPAVDQRLDRSTCTEPLRARARALAHMREVAQELGELATTGQGTAFDALRAAATVDPFDAGTTDLETVASSTNCPEVSAVVDTPRDLVATVRELESALNPAELVEG